MVLRASQVPRGILVLRASQLLGWAQGQEWAVARCWHLPAYPSAGDLPNKKSANTLPAERQRAQL